MNWQQKFKNFEIITNWEKYNNPENPKRKLNEYRLVKIDFKLYLEVKTQKPEITFLTDLKYFEYIKKYTWTNYKQRNNFYIITERKKLFHRLIHPEWKIIDHINREGCDNRECNLRDGSGGINQRNCRLQKDNTSGINAISYEIKQKRWRFHWWEGKKQNVKNFKNKHDAINFKLIHNQISGNINGNL
jgi:hypothetical protein